jgi:hypothetical protein
MIRAIFAGTVAVRSSVADGEQMIIGAETAVTGFRRLRGRRQTKATVESGS